MKQATSEGPRPDAYVAACPSRALLARIGDKWSMLVLTRLGEGEKRYGMLQRSVEGISRKVLTQTLRGLERDGLVLRRRVEDARANVSYRLTAGGRRLLPLVARLKRWAEQHLERVQRANATFDRRAG